MSFNSMLYHKANLHKLKTNDVSKGYGLPTTKEDYYSATPDDVDIPCNVREQSTNNPQRVGAGYTIPVTYKIIFPFSYHNVIQFGDIIVWEGIKIKLNAPTPIKNHHIEVTGSREDEVTFNGS